MIQEFIDRHFYNLFLITLFFGVILYGLIGFQAIDELCVFILFFFFLFRVFQTKSWEVNRIFIIILGVFLFYLCYSLYIGSNSIRAILMDFFIQMKPFLAFFCVYQITPSFTKSQKILLRQICIVCWFILLPFGIYSIMDENILWTVMGHASNYASSISALSLLTLFASDFTKRDKFIFVCMLALGLVSGRAKFYGFFILSSFLVFYSDYVINFKFNFKNVLVVLALLALILFVAKDKIELYFLQGISENAEKDLIARFALYATSGSIFMDYMPFGSGFASFATHASGVYYSPIYIEYGIDGVWGLSKSYTSFVADTFYPSLAQFGVAGVVLFVLFWLFLMRKAYLYAKKTGDVQLMVLAVMIIGYFAIENVADASFTSNRGLFFMMFLGLIFGNMKQQQKTHASNHISSRNG